MASVKIVLSEQEVEAILINTVREKFRIPSKTELHLNWSDDFGVTVETPEANLDTTSWLDE